MTNETKNSKKKIFKTNLTVKIISMMMIMLLLTCFTVPTIANAVAVNTESVGEAIEEGITDDGWKYSINDKGYAGIGKYMGTDTTVEFPSNIKGYPVGYVGSYLLKDTPVKKLIISDTESPLEAYSYEGYDLNTYFRDTFSSSTNLEEVEIGSMFANAVPKNAFQYCKKLKKVTFTDDFSKKARELGGCYIAHYAFSDCPSLKSFVFPEGVTEIEGRAFENDMIENFVFEGYIPNCSLTSLLIKKESLMAIKNIVIFDDTITIGYNYGDDEYLTNSKFYAPKDSDMQTFLNYDNLSFVDITTVDIDGFINSIMNDENPSAPQPITQPTSATSETSETSDTTSSTGITGDTEEYSTSTTLSPISSTTIFSSTPYATEETTKPADKNEPYCVCLYNRSFYINKKVSDFRMGGNNISYTSNNKKVATVTQNGVISTKSKGKAIITITNKGNNTCVKVNLTVKNYPKPTLSKTSLKLKKGQSYTLKISKRMTKATYSSSNKKIATVNKYGKIKANKKKKGTAIITVKANYYTLKCKVKVK